jgi:hypothetical protein
MDLERIKDVYRGTTVYGVSSHVCNQQQTLEICEKRLPTHSPRNATPRILDNIWTKLLFGINYALTSREYIQE